MNILDINISTTSQKLKELWTKLSHLIDKANLYFLDQKREKFLKTITKINNLHKECNRFYKRLIYQVATFNLFGTHLRKIISYLNISNDFFRILTHYKSFLKFLTFNNSTPIQINFILSQWKILIEQEKIIRDLFFNPSKTKVIEFLKSSNQSNTNLSNQFVNFKPIINELINSNRNEHMQKTLIFIENIYSLKRISDHFIQILENLLLVLDFTLYKRYRNEKNTK